MYSARRSVHSIHGHVPLRLQEHGARLQAGDSVDIYGPSSSTLGSARRRRPRRRRRPHPGRPCSCTAAGSPSSLPAAPRPSGPAAYEGSGSNLSVSGIDLVAVQSSGVQVPRGETSRCSRPSRCLTAIANAAAGSTPAADPAAAEGGAACASCRGRPSRQRGNRIRRRARLVVGTGSRHHALWMPTARAATVAVAARIDEHAVPGQRVQPRTASPPPSWSVRQSRSASRRGLRVVPGFAIPAAPGSHTAELLVRPSRASPRSWSSSTAARRSRTPDLVDGDGAARALGFALHAVFIVVRAESDLLDNAVRTLRTLTIPRARLCWCSRPIVAASRRRSNCSRRRCPDIRWRANGSGTRIAVSWRELAGSRSSARQWPRSWVSSDPERSLQYHASPRWPLDPPRLRRSGDDRRGPAADRCPPGGRERDGLARMAGDSRGRCSRSWSSSVACSIASGG